VHVPPEESSSRLVALPLAETRTALPGLIRCTPSTALFFVIALCSESGITLKIDPIALVLAGLAVRDLVKRPWKVEPVPVIWVSYARNDKAGAAKFDAVAAVLFATEFTIEASTPPDTPSPLFPFEVTFDR
jgi:hypothetical protein